MSRNVPSLQELLAQRRSKGSTTAGLVGERSGISSPKFLSKRERSTTKDTTPTSTTASKLPIKRKAEPLEVEEESEPQVKRDIVQETIDANYAKVLSRAQGGNARKRFQFSWKDEDDTSSPAGTGSTELDYYEPVLAVKKDDILIKSSRGEEKHWSEKTQEEMSARDWRIFTEDYGISIKLPAASSSNKKKKKLYPLRRWDEMTTNEQLKAGVMSLGFEEPTPIQRVSIPYACSSYDLISVAQTGSGKTLGFLVPLLDKLLSLGRLNEYSKADGPYGVVLVPTRELAQQIETELRRLIRMTRLDIDVVSIVGGKVIADDIKRLSGDRVEIVIATPGRLIDCLERHYLVLNQVQCLVLDECDKMIEMRFKDQILKIKEFIPERRQRECQGLMFTATLGGEIEKVLKEFVHQERCVTLQVGDVTSTDLTVNERIEQKFEFFPGSDEKDIENKKQRKLISLLRSAQPPVIVFVNYKETGETLVTHLQSSRFKVAILHGSKSQAQREAALEQLKSHQVDILIATNVASRGIDIPDISLVVNYQMSKNVEDYVHRVGRTGRAGNYGTAVTFLETERDQPVFKGLKRVVERNGGRLPREFRGL